ncbi:MAG: M48 family metallopeptidase [Patescibacteria group bacterium]|nr:M48 family metallopeptidase [Patescibacteria group bacterium]
MATLYTHQDGNSRKTWLLMAVFLVVVIAIGWVFSQIYGDPAILYLAVGLSVIMNFVSYWHSDKIALKMSGAREVSAQEQPELHRVVENLAITAGLPKPRVCLINDPAPNAFATGRDKEHAAVAVTSGLLNMLERSELEGVVAHELAHIGNRDILLSTVVVVLVGLIAIISDIFLRSMFWGGHGRSRDNKGGGVLLLIGIALAILSPIIATIIRLAISRKREFLADASGALLTRYPEGLASALEKISGYSGGLKKASNATAHLFIANPFGAKAKKGMHKLFMTHPPVAERVGALRGRA